MAADKALLSGSDGAYRDYIRAYVPETAQLQSITLTLGKSPLHEVAPEAVTYELHRQAIAYWLVLPRGQSATVVLHYSGPFADISEQPERYSLVWGKQVNALTWPISVSIRLPTGPATRHIAQLRGDTTFAVSAPRS